MEQKKRKENKCSTFKNYSIRHYLIYFFNP